MAVTLQLISISRFVLVKNLSLSDSTRFSNIDIFQGHCSKSVYHFTSLSNFFFLFFFFFCPYKFLSCPVPSYLFAICWIHWNMFLFMVYILMCFSSIRVHIICLSIILKPKASDAWNIRLVLPKIQYCTYFIPLCCKIAHQFVVQIRHVAQIRHCCSHFIPPIILHSSHTHTHTHTHTYTHTHI